MAHAMGADLIEQDVVLTKDDVPVVLHDVHLDTVSDVARVFPNRARKDGRYYALDFTLAELRTLRLTERFDPKTGKPVFPGRFPQGKADFRLPTLEEELELISGLNTSTGRKAGVYVEIKQPKWHRDQGHDISALVLPLLRKHGYAKRTDACWVQCFEWDEVQRIRQELRWEGNLLLLLSKSHAMDDARLTEVATVVNGLGPELSAIFSGASPGDRRMTNFVKQAHHHGLAVHPYTLRVDDLPVWAATTQEALKAMCQEAGADGLFTDFPDVMRAWVDLKSK